MEEQDELKSVAQLEEEARARAKAELGKNAPEEKPAAGQPAVVQHNKPKGKRTLIVFALSFVLLVVLAIGGDYISGKLKGKKEEAPSREVGQKAPVNERKDLGQDENPLAALISHKKVGAEADRQPSESEENASPPPVTFNKAAALAESGTQQIASGQNSPPSSDRTSGECKTPLQKAPDGKLYCPDTMTPSSPVEGVATITGVKRINLDPNLYIPADRYIPCSMMRRFVSDVAGRISCMIGQDVYSANNFVKLIPAGTIARGFYKTGTLNHGQGRMFIAWAELRTPDKLQIPLADADVVGQLGEAGVEGWIDTHFSERFLGSMMVGMIPDVAAWAADQSGSKDRNTDYTENSRQAFADIAKSAFDNSVNIPPTMYLNQGDVIGIMTATDIDFSDVYKLRMH
ncbi:conjugation TrbI-like protein [Klebsiella pneumoniae]|uniref:VirB10/TraB/TrbI family type IV secretion system protein n=2 Tax=Klebsiella pneumoniae TaxID=573 RepID=UPI000E2B8619|nr:VirB10/TraB/TrbI family type IV secretion system protein [Klebsiella pneumoniae]SYT49020.1 conjugation TrbI-like protein [Klebsiella pneumoniae]